MASGDQQTRDQGLESQAQHEDKFYDIGVKRGINHKPSFFISFLKYVYVQCKAENIKWSS